MVAATSGSILTFMTRHGGTLIARLLFAAALLCEGLGCGPILGIDDASCDPGLPACDPSKVPDVDGGPQSLCEMYCNRVMTNCTGNFAVYVGMETCMSVCQLLPPGTKNDVSGNTVYCRLNLADNAKSTGEPNVECPGAGPGGNDLCGGNCEALCIIMQSACSSSWSSTDDCQADCRALRDNQDFSISTNAGDTVQCRLWHASAATQAAIPHCAHAKGATPCD